MKPPPPALPDPVDWSIERFDSVDSTQDLLRRRIAAGEDVHGTVVRAASQSGGRGRFRRVWSSPPGGSYQSVALVDAEARFASGSVPIAVAVAIADELETLGSIVGIKWPNDLYLPGTSGHALGGKVAGILCERVGSHLVIGVGVNVGNPVTEGAAALRGRDVEQVSDAVLRGVANGLRGLLGDGRLDERFASRDLLRGRAVTLREGERELKGRASGVSDRGCLLLEISGTVVETCGGRITAIDAATS